MGETAREGLENLSKLKVFCVTILGLFSFIFSCVYSVNNPEEVLVGGPCDYRKYKGHAKIESITLKKQQKNYTHEVYEVKYSFIPDQIIEEPFARPEGKEFVLLLKNSAYPGSKFLKKYDIRVGRIFKCTMNVITKGTCTPVIFEFPTIRLDDYIEN